ncbi:hypothetical protein C4D60_Mb06t04350 [Musa balbisiana]|uniref:Uncharacterized protein n=1 Tax=Musa balbisiana TaxID=52838 RepID=A0A4V4H3N4_MUSBA|nr:hypothetical protein C4D60_Mb06t04350 [Musa balbisiana]
MFAVEHVDYPVKGSYTLTMKRIGEKSNQNDLQALFSISTSECCEICDLPQYELPHHALLVPPL